MLTQLITRYNKYTEVVPDSGDEGRAGSGDDDEDSLVARTVGADGSDGSGDDGAWDYTTLKVGTHGGCCFNTNCFNTSSF